MTVPDHNMNPTHYQWLELLDPDPGHNRIDGGS
jgi:hypothetical protein